MGRTSWSAADLPGGLWRVRIRRLSFHYHCVNFYRRRLPHLYQGDQPVFLTWRLHGSLPAGRCFPPVDVTSGEAFAALDRILDEARTGPLHLRRQALADMVVEAIHYNAAVLGRYALDAFVVMPNHVHLLIGPHVPLPRLTKALKGFTAKRANEMLSLTGNPFWQAESYDHLVRDRAEWERIGAYIERNPVRAGLVQRADEYRWSSAGWPTGRPAADQEVRPTIPLLP